MKKIYDTIQVKVIVYETEDVIRTSGVNPDTGGNELPSVPMFSEGFFTQS